MVCVLIAFSCTVAAVFRNSFCFWNTWVIPLPPHFSRANDHNHSELNASSVNLRSLCLHLWSMNHHKQYQTMWMHAKPGGREHDICGHAWPKVVEFMSQRVATALRPTLLHMRVARVWRRERGRHWVPCASWKQYFMRPLREDLCGPVALRRGLDYVHHLLFEAKPHGDRPRVPHLLDTVRRLQDPVQEGPRQALQHLRWNHCDVSPVF